jgi:hypothetical protein
VNSEVTTGVPLRPAELLVADAAHQRDSVGLANGLVKESFDAQDEH